MVTLRLLGGSLTYCLQLTSMHPNIKVASREIPSGIGQAGQVAVKSKEQIDQIRMILPSCGDSSWIPRLRHWVQSLIMFLFSTAVTYHLHMTIIPQASPVSIMNMIPDRGENLTFYAGS